MGKARHILTVALIVIGLRCVGQTHAISTNLLSDVAASPEIALSTVVSPQWTVGISVTGCPVTTERYFLRFISAGAEARKWIYEPYAGHFISFGGNFVSYRIGKTESPYHGNGVTIGVGYGYAWLIGRRWNIECAAGVGLAYTWDQRIVTDVEDIQYIHFYRRLTIVPYSVRVGISYLF